MAANNVFIYTLTCLILLTGVTMLLMVRIDIKTARCIIPVHLFTDTKQNDPIYDAPGKGKPLIEELLIPTASSPNQQTAMPNVSTTFRRHRLRNILFIIADDLRPQIGAYFDPEHPDYFSRLRIHTPNLDRLASKSLVFRRAYAQYSLCGPSRTSLLTSRRPDVTRIYDNKHYWREVGGNFTSLPQYFKDNGYTTAGLGKVFHPDRSSNDDDPLSWTVPYYHSTHSDRRLLSRKVIMPRLAVTPEQMKNTTLVDVNTTAMAKALLRRFARMRGRPFFVAVGYHRPHRSMMCPAVYYDLYPLEDQYSFLPNETWQWPTLSKSIRMDGLLTVNGERRLPATELRKLRQAYFACISYIDGLVGELLDELEDLGLANNTVVIFMADHGFHLGENGHWGKTSTWEISNRIPLMIRVPGLTDAGLVTASLVEALDVFPTIVEAAGLEPVPPCQHDGADVRLCTQGVSLMPLFADPSLQIKTAAFSQVVNRKYVWYTMRTKRFRLSDKAFITASKLTNGKNRLSVRWSRDTSQTILFDHDIDVLEQINLTNDPRYRNVLINLRTALHQFVEKQFYLRYLEDETFI